MTSPASICLVLCLVLASPASSSAGSVMITKGSTLLEGNLEGLVTLPGGLTLSRMEIDVASWGVNYGAEDFVVYDPAMAVCSRYEEALILNLPGTAELLTSVDGKSGTLIQFLEEEPYVIYDTDLRMIGVMGLYPSGAPYPLPYAGGYGDVNADGTVDLLDAISAIQVCVGMKRAQAVNTNADVNGDGKIGMAEVIYILQKAAGLR
jgi:hypothetical protein